jgi:hypothetical protein
MSEILQKIKLLREFGYKNDWRRRIYYNVTSRKIFSLEALEANSDDWVRAKISEAKKGWGFFFKDEPTKKLQMELIRLLSQRRCEKGEISLP